MKKTKKKYIRYNTAARVMYVRNVSSILRRHDFLSAHSSIINDNYKKSWTFLVRMQVLGQNNIVKQSYIFDIELVGKFNYTIQYQF
jgi:hypothetical protein